MNSTSITITKYELLHHMKNYFGVYKQRLSFQFLLGVLISLTLSLFTSDFKPAFGLSKSHIEAIFFVIYVIAFLFLLVDLFRKFKQPARTVDEFCDELMKNSFIQNYEPTCLFINNNRIGCERTQYRNGQANSA